MADSSFISNFKALWFIAVFVALTALAAARIGNSYAAAAAENKINTYNQSRFNDFYALPENSLDMVFIGSSHSYCTFDPELFDEALGTSSFQMGMPLQSPDGTYFTLLEILKTQHPQTVVLEVYWGMMARDFDSKQMAMLFQVLRGDELKRLYMDAFPLPEKIRYNVDILKYQADYFAYQNKKLQEYTEARFGVTQTPAETQQGTEYYRSKGYVYCDYQMVASKRDRTNQFRGLDGKTFVFSDVQLRYLQKIIDLCKAEGISLIMVTAPVANVSMGYIQNYDAIHAVPAALAERNQLRYIDYNLINSEEHLLTDENFRDDAHLNHSGIEIVDRYFIELLQ